MTDQVQISERGRISKVCDDVNLELIEPGYSGVNSIESDEKCGKFFIFIDADSDLRIAFAGVLIYHDPIKEESFGRFREYLAKLIITDGEAGHKVSVTPIKSESTASPFDFGFLRTQLGQKADPSVWSYWSIGLKNIGGKTVVIFDALPALIEPQYQDILTQNEKASIDELGREVNEWREANTEILAQQFATMEEQH